MACHAALLGRPAVWSSWAAEVSALKSTARSKNKQKVKKNALCYDDKTLVSRRSTDLLMIYFSLYSLRQRITLRYRIPLDLYLQLDLISHCPSTLSPPLCTSDVQEQKRQEGSRGLNKPSKKQIQECASIYLNAHDARRNMPSA